MNRQIIGSILTLSLGLAALGITACDDETTDQYHDQQVQKEIAQAYAVKGTYTGTATSQSDGSQIGPVSLVINPASTPTTSSDGTQMVEQSNVNGSIQIVGVSSGQASFTGGTYDPDTGHFVASVPILGSDGTTVTETLNLSGTFSGATFTGEIDSQEDPGQGPKIVAQLTNAPLSASVISGASKGSFNADMSYFSGSAIGQSMPVTLSIQDASDTVGQSLVDMVDPLIQDVDVTVTLNGNVPVTFADAQLDLRNGVLQDKGPYSSGTSTSTAKLKCNKEGTGWSCSFSGSLNSVITPFQVSPAPAPTLPMTVK